MPDRVFFLAKPAEELKPLIRELLIDPAHSASSEYARMIDQMIVQTEGTVRTLLREDALGDRS
jgi:hypothetical protein